LIHLLHDECEQLIRRLFSHFIHENLMKNKTLDELIHIRIDNRDCQKTDSSKIKIQKVEFRLFFFD
jgi:hypothetical protein